MCAANALYRIVYEIYNWLALTWIRQVVLLFNHWLAYARHANAKWYHFRWEILTATKFLLVFAIWNENKINQQQWAFPFTYNFSMHAHDHILYCWCCHNVNGTAFSVCLCCVCRSHSHRSISLCVWCIQLLASRLVRKAIKFTAHGKEI